MKNIGNITAGFSFRLSAFVLVGCLALAMPSAAFAEGEITLVIGGLAGGDLNNILKGDVSIAGSYENGPLYGLRLGAISRFVGIEGSYVGSPSGLALSDPARSISLNGRVYYLEGNLLLIPIPGPISPFVTVGGGLHSYKLDAEGGGQTSSTTDIQKAGWNFGGGLKINIGAVTLRGEVRDHITRIGPGDFDFSEIAETFGFSESQRLHNVEIAAGIGIRF